MTTRQTEVEFQAWTSEGLTRIVLPATLEGIDRTAEYVRQQWKNAGLSRQVMFKLCLVVREALINAVTHGCKNDPVKKVELFIRSGEKQADIEVRDQGDGFDWRKAMVSCQLPPDPTSETGRGLCIMTNYASHMTFNDTGNILTLRVTWA